MECSTLKLIVEKGPREGETLEYSSGSVIKIGRVVRGNTIGIKDPGISSKHISIQFDNDLSKWNLTDLDSSNGTFLNGEMILPNVPSALKEGDCIKIGELTSIIVQFGAQSTIPSERNTRRRGKSGAAAAAERDQSELGLGLDGDVGKNALVEPVRKRTLRPRGKKAVDSKNEVDSVNSKRILRSSRKEESASSIPTLNKIREDTNPDVGEPADQIAPVERKVTRGRPKKLPVQHPKDPDSDKGKKTRRGRKGLPVEQWEDLQITESVPVHLSEKPTSRQHDADKDPEHLTENAVENSVLNENLDANDESDQDHVAEGSVKETSVDTSRWQDLEKMTLGDFFDYLEWYLPKEIREKTEVIISQLPEKTRKYHEARLQRDKQK